MKGAMKNVDVNQVKKDYKKIQVISQLAKKYGIEPSSMGEYLEKMNIPRIPKKQMVKNHNLFSENNEKSFYLAGFLAADGNIFSSKYSKYITVALSKSDEKFLRKIHKLFEINSKISTVYSKSNINGRSVKSITKRFSFASHQMCNDLMTKFNLSPDKSLSLKFPKKLSTHPLIHHFIRGYFDGDGCFYERKSIKNIRNSSINFSLVGTKNFMTNVQNVIINNTNLVKNKLYKKDNIYCIMWNGNQNIIDLGNWLYKDATIFLERKHKLFLKSKKFLEKNKNSKWYIGRYKFDE